MELYCHSSLYEGQLMTLRDFVSRHQKDRICYCLDSCVLIEIERYVLKREVSLSQEDINLLRQLQNPTDSYLEAAIAIEEVSRPRGENNAAMAPWYREVMNCFYDKRSPRIPRPEVTVGDYPLSYVSLLSDEFVLRNFLIISYSCALKTLSLLKDVEEHKMSREQASVIFMNFIVEKICFVPVPMIVLFLRILYGDTKLKTIIYPTKNQGLYKIYNGSMDMILPVAYRSFVIRRFPGYQYAFVTADKGLAKMDSYIVEYSSSGVGGSLYEPRIVSVDLSSIVKREDVCETIYAKLLQLNYVAARHEIKKGGNNMLHFLPNLPELEQEVRDKFSLGKGLC